MMNALAPRRLACGLRSPGSQRYRYGGAVPAARQVLSNHGRTSADWYLSSGSLLPPVTIASGPSAAPGFARRAAAGNGHDTQEAAVRRLERRAGNS